MSTTDTSLAAYHHGDLRRALLDAASSIITETGQWDFSLREVARRAGVSHNAPYRHFEDKEALLVAVAVAGFETLREHTSAASTGKDSASDALTAIGQAYINFGIANPALYRLMFGRGPVGTGKVCPEVAQAARANRAVVRKAILFGANTKEFAVDASSPSEVAATVVAAGSLVHGLTLLIIDDIVERIVDRAPVDNLISGVLRRFMVGLTNQQM